MKDFSDGKGEDSGEKDSRSDMTEGERGTGHLYSSSIIIIMRALAVAGTGLLKGEGTDRHAET